jgi:aspartyl-tRNA synthetase
LEPEILQSLQQAFGAESGDLLLLLADTWTKTCIGLDFLRTRIARELDLCPNQEFCLTWLIDDTRKPQHTQATWPESETAEPDRSTSATLLTHSNRFLLVANGREIGRGKTIHAAENASADSQLDDMTEQFFVTLDVYHLAQTLTALSRQRDNSSMPATQLAKDLSLYNHF